MKYCSGHSQRSLSSLLQQLGTVCLHLCLQPRTWARDPDPKPRGHKHFLSYGSRLFLLVVNAWGLSTCMRGFYFVYKNVFFLCICNPCRPAAFEGSWAWPTCIRSTGLSLCCRPVQLDRTHQECKAPTRITSQIKSSTFFLFHSKENMDAWITNKQSKSTSVKDWQFKSA